MEPEVLVALLSAAGPVIGSLGGILVSNKMTKFRLNKLEEKVDKHNHLVERMAAVEQSVKSAHHRIDELREED